MSTTILLLFASALAAAPHWEPANNPAIKSYNKGVEALNTCNPEAAERHFRKSLSKDPGCGTCSHALATALLRQDRALEAYEVAAETCLAFPNEFDPALTLANAAFVAERFKHSIEVSETLLNAQPGNLDVLHILVRGLLRTGDTARARAALQQSTEQHGEEIIACELGKVALEEDRIGEARVLLETCKLAEDEEASKALESRILTFEGRYAEASELRSEALDGDEMIGRLYRANAFIEAGDYESAIPLLRESLEHHRQDAETAVLLGLCEYNLGHNDAAMEALELAFEGETWISVGREGSLVGILTASGERGFQRRMREGVARLVMLQAESGRHKDARTTLERAKKELEPSGELAAAEVQLLMAQERYEDAAGAAVRSLLRWPDSPLLIDTVSFLGSTHAQARTPALEQALALAGEWRALYNGAVDLHNTGDHAGCLARLDDGPTFEDPDAQAEIASLAYVCAATADDLEAATLWLPAAGGAEAADPYALYNHADMLIREERLDEALELVTAQQPEDEEIALYLRTLQVVVHTQQDDSEAALAVHTAGPVGPYARVNLGIVLANAERVDEAVEMIEDACGELDSKEDRSSCMEMLEGMKAAEGED